MLYTSNFAIIRPKTTEREITPLLKVRDPYDKYIFSMDEQDMSQKGIKHKNIIKFLKNDYC